MRHLDSVKMTTDMVLGNVRKLAIVDRGSFFLPTLFSHRLADCAAISSTRY